MAVLPNSRSAVLPRRTSVPIVTSRRLDLLLLGGLGLVGGSLWIGGDHLARRIYAHWQPRLERQITEVLGHPLELGPYRGFDLVGLRIGPSRIAPGPRDASEVRVAGGRLGLDPWASLQRWSPVLEVSLQGGDVHLRRNREGRYWVMGSPRPGQRPPRLEVRLRLADPARVRISPAGLDLRVQGGTGLALEQKRLDLGLQLRPALGPGRVGLEGGGHWDRQRWYAQVELDRLPVERLQGFTALPGRTRGDLQGRLALTLTEGEPRCQGSLNLRQLGWRRNPGSAEFSLPAAALRCSGDALVLERSPWRFAGWNGSVAGRTDRSRRLSLSLEARPPAPAAAGRGRRPTPPLPPLRAEGSGRWSGRGVELASLELKTGRSEIRARGLVGPQLRLDGRWQLHPADLPLPSGAPSWLGNQFLQGDLALRGKPADPSLAVQLLPYRNPITGPLTASLLWQGGLLRLQQVRAPHLSASGTLPLARSGSSPLKVGPLDLQVSVDAFPLERLHPLVGAPLRGTLSAGGSVRGPLGDLRPDLALSLDSPSVGPLGLQELWSGRLIGHGSTGESPRLQLESRAEAGGSLTARLNRRWMPVAVELQRGEGKLSLTGSPASYRWQAAALPLQGLSLAVGPQRRPQPLQGLLSGEGSLGFQPLAFGGWVSLEQPAFLGVRARNLEASLQYADRRWKLTGDLVPLTGGTVGATATGRWQGPYRARLEGRDLTASLLRELGRAVPQWRGQESPPTGRAADLGTLVIDQLGGSLEDQLVALARARERLLAARRTPQADDPAARLSRAQALVDADLTLEGPDLPRTRIDLQARGHLWLEEDGTDRALGLEPFVVSLQGAVRGGDGSFDFSSLPLSLLALLTPVPSSLQGSLSARGRYNLAGATPELEAWLGLEKGRIGTAALRLERGSLQLREGHLDADVALMADGAGSAVEFTGRIPLDPQAQSLEVRLASRGDGLRFLTTLAGRSLDWEKGSADLQLLVRGSLADPIANGFLRLREGELTFIGQPVRALEATVLFDFEELLLQEFTARVGEKGRVEGQGKLGLVRPLGDTPSLSLRLDQVPFRLARINARSDGTLAFGGSLRAPLLGGDLAISRGTINVQPGSLGTGEAGSSPSTKSAGANPEVNDLLQRQWAFDRPLVLLGPEVESSSAEALRQAVPNFPYLRFDDLTLRLGPDLRVIVPNVANFNTGGALRLQGPLDPSLQARGVVRLLNGRLNLFTTSFNLDPDAPNVAVFTPSLGLLPYLDIALRTRVSENLSSNLGGTTGSGLGLAELEAQGGFNSLNQLKLVRITVSVSGPADRIAENLRLTSDPPLPEERLVALIGGNSLAGLSGGNAGAALATALGQSLLSPLLGSLSDAFGQRVSFALYPTYVNPVVSQAEELRSRQLPPQLVLGSEIGLDVTERFNASVLVAPNRSDIPPQVTLNYKASQNLNLQGSFDTQGAWQTQMQIFFRF
jgi:translocation and assembly module TamB